MVVRVEQNFSVVNSCFVVLCVLASIENLCATPQQGGGSSVSSHGIGFDNLTKNLKANDLAQTTRNKQNARDGPTVGKPAARAASPSVSNFEKLEASEGSRKNINRKSQDGDNYKNDGVIFPPSSSGVSPRTVFNNDHVIKTLIPDSEEIEFCKSNAIVGTSLCNITQKYPTSFVRNLLTERELTPELFGNDLLAPGLGPYTIDNRFKDDHPGLKSLCQSREFLHFPKLGKTWSNEWKYILQNDNDSMRYVQGIRVEVCSDESRKCDLVDNFPNGYSFQCVQKFIYRRLVAISPKDKKSSIAPDNFEFPSCCVCVYKTDVEFRTSFGKNQQSSSPASPKASPSKPTPSKPSPPKSPPRG